MKKVIVLFCTSIFLFSCSNPERDFQKAKDKNTIASLEGFLEKYPGSEFTEEAEKAIYTLAFYSVNETDSLELLQEFLVENPDGEFTEEAERAIYLLTYEKVIQSDSIHLIKDFLTKYPEKEYTDSAYKRLCELEFRLAERVNIYDVYKAYVNKYPDSYLLEDAQKRMSEVAPITDLDKIDSLLKEYYKSSANQKPINVINSIDGQALRQYIKDISLGSSAIAMSAAISFKEYDAEISEFRASQKKFDPFIFLCGNLYLEGNEDTSFAWLDFVQGFQAITLNGINETMEMAIKCDKSKTTKKIGELVISFIPTVLETKFKNSQKIKPLIKRYQVDI